MTRQQLVETAFIVLEHQGLTRDIFFDVTARELGGVQSVGAQVKCIYELPDETKKERAREEFQMATGGLMLSIY